MELFENAFLGIHDKNGKPIHNGNEVRFYYKGEYVTCTIIYSLKTASFCLLWPDGYINSGHLNPEKYEIVTP